jgi:beta-alanine degradation protein BauB
MHNGTRARPGETSPQYYKVLLENDQVRVLDYHLKPGEKEPMHSHSAGVKREPPPLEKLFWREPVTHAVENIGDTEAHAIAIDLKISGKH